jgi:hypothetical protein
MLIHEMSVRLIVVAYYDLSAADALTLTIITTVAVMQ